VDDGATNGAMSNGMVGPRSVSAPIMAGCGGAGTSDYRAVSKRPWKGGR
jgi:hypothetical protein